MAPLSQDSQVRVDYKYTWLRTKANDFVESFGQAETVQPAAYSMGINAAVPEGGRSHFTVRGRTR